MNKREKWIECTADRLFSEYCGTGQTIMGVIKKALVLGLDTEIKDDVYSYEVCKLKGEQPSSTQYKYWYQVFRNGDWCSDSGIVFTSRNQAERAAQSIINILQED